MWLASQRSRSAQPCLQTGPWEIVQTSCADRSHCSSFTAAGVPVAKEPVGLVRQDGKRPDGLMLIPFEGSRSLTWDVIVCSTADSYIDLALQGPGCVAEIAASLRRNAPLCRLAMTSRQLRSRPWVLSMSRPLLFCMIWVCEFRSRAGRTESLSSCFNAFQSPSSALKLCFCTTVFLSSDHPDY